MIILNSLYERDGFQQKLLEKAYFFVKMTGPTIVQPTSFDFCKAPLESKGHVTRPSRQPCRYCGDSILSTQTFNRSDPLLVNLGNSPSRD